MHTVLAPLWEAFLWLKKLELKLGWEMNSIWWVIGGNILSALYPIWRISKQNIHTSLRSI
jgi:hypothetical protein